MKRQIGLWPAVGLTLVTLLIGLGGGVAAGVTVGYWYASRDPQGQTASAGSARAGAGEAQTSTESVNQIVARVNPAVVTIVNQLQPGSTASGGSSQQETGIGTGMILDTQGYIVTNNHVVDGAASLDVIFTDGRRVSATLVGSDQYQDVAVIKVNPPVPATITFGDSSTLQPGQKIIAIGSALGEFRNTVTEGVVSASGRSLDTGNGWRLENLVQHDAPINPGNSGGPLIDMSGNVVGMNTAIVRGSFGQPGSEGLGFAIASDTVRSFARQLIANGTIDRPYVGIYFRSVSQSSGSAETEAQPVVVAQVAPGSPAEQAGIQVGDLIVAVEGTTLDTQHPFLNALYTYKVGDTVTLKVQRSGATHEIKVTLAKKPAS